MNNNDEYCNWHAGDHMIPAISGYFFGTLATGIATIAFAKATYIDPNIYDAACTVVFAAASLYFGKQYCRLNNEYRHLIYRNRKSKSP